jgi:hypothetical protein
VYRALEYGRRNKNRELWEERFRSQGSFTLESTILLERVILTADPENIKAILHSQFNEYGMLYK